MRNRKERVVLNGQVPSLADVNAWVAQVFTISLLLSLIYINYLADDLSNAKLFADDASLFYVVHNGNTSAAEVSNDLVEINKWTHIPVEWVSILIQLNPKYFFQLFPKNDRY